MTNENPLHNCGVLLVNKPRGKTSFSLIGRLRKALDVRKIGHAGTLDPFATGVMVLLVGREYTRLSDQFLGQDKEYTAEIYLGAATDTHDPDGKITFTSDRVPTREEIDEAIANFQGTVEQTPPMYSAKKVGGEKLYDLARKGQTVERKPSIVNMTTKVCGYDYPLLTIHVQCSKGTYVRTIADDLGKILGTGAHLTSLTRVRSGIFHLKECLDGKLLFDSQLDPHIVKSRLIHP